MEVALKLILFEGLDKLISGDVYLSGCPPKLEAVIDAIT